jgi:flagellum-specific ATP synthase
MERSGTAVVGTITAFYTILVEGDDMNEPIADHARSILDGHIVLSRKLASANQYPPVDVLNSLSRVMKEVVTDESYQMAGRLRAVLQTYKEAEDLINIGAYVKGSNPKIDESLLLIESIRSFLKQDTKEGFTYEETIKLLESALMT